MPSLSVFVYQEKSVLQESMHGDGVLCQLADRYSPLFRWSIGNANLSHSFTFAYFLCLPR